MKIHRILALILGVFALTLAHGFAGAINKSCPIKKGKEASKEATVEISFCCEKCKAKFDADPAAALSKVADAAEGKCPMSGKDVDAAQTSSIAIGVCCNSCKKKIEEDPKKYLKDVKKD